MCASGTFAGPVGRPLPRTGRALRQLPFAVEQVLEVAVRPLDRSGRPGALETAGDRVGALAAAVAALPAEALLLEGGRLGLGADVAGRTGAVDLAERVTAGDQGDGLLVVHGHAGEGGADVLGRGQRIRLAVRALGVHVDQTHLHGGERVGELAVAGVAGVGQPLALGAPVDVLLRLPHVLATAAEAEGLQTRVLEGDVAGQDHQVGPRDLLAVLLLDRPEQATGLVEVGVVGPAVQRRETLRAVGGAAAPVGRAVGAGAVPGHADEERTVVAPVGRPPVLRVGHDLVDVLLQGLEVELGELRGVVEVAAQRIALERVLMEDLEIELVRPPVLVRHGLAGHLVALAVALLRVVVTGRVLGESERRDENHREARYGTREAILGDHVIPSFFEF